MEQTDKQKEFLEKTIKVTREILDPIALEGLAKMVSDDVMIYDIHYIDARIRQIVEERIRSFEFEDEEIKKKRIALLKKAVAEALKKEVKPAEQPNDATGDRNKRCEALCQEMADKLMADVVFDEYWLSEAIKQDDFLLAFNRLRSMMDSLSEIMMFSIDTSYRKANEKIWGKVKEDISLKEIDGMLKATES